MGEYLVNSDGIMRSYSPMNTLLVTIDGMGTCVNDCKLLGLNMKSNPEISQCVCDTGYYL